jgi:hypothetical protein
MIYVSGYSGVGKSKFCSEMSEQHSLPLVKEVIRKNQNESQLFFYNEYLRIHHEKKGLFISDRSVVDVACWNSIDSVFDDLKDTRIPDLVLIPSPPKLKWVIDNIEFWKNDPVRKRAFYDKLDLESEKEVSDLVYATLICRQFRLDFSNILDVYDTLGWKVDVCQGEDENYFSWQDKGREFVESFLKSC